MLQNHSHVAEVAISPTVRPELAFRDLSDDMLARLLEYGTKENFPENTLLFTRGERNVDMFVILGGSIDIYAVSGSDERTLFVTLWERRFTGELDRSPLGAL
jgi:thioredoxin reductase (NADPH)